MTPGSSETDRIKELRAGARAIEMAMREAAREAVLRHQRLGLPMVTWRDGKVVWVPAEELELPSPDASESLMSAPVAAACYTRRMNKSNSPPSRGALFRFGTRDLLWAMVVVALVLGWWRTYRRVAIAEHNAEALQGAFNPGELTFDRSGRIREMPLWSPLSSGRSTGRAAPPASGK